MDRLFPATLPTPHKDFLIRALDTLTQQPWLVGVAATGSFASDTMDEFSDLDLLLVVETEKHAAAMKDRLSIAALLGSPLSAFTGEHVGQPRLVLCLYGPHLLHVDILIETLPDVANRVDIPAVLWEREERLTATLRSLIAIHGGPDPQWMEDRFWVWVHKAAGKIGRGELFEAIEYLAFLRSRVLGPLCLSAAGLRPAGVRSIERDAPSAAQDLKATLADHNAANCLVALKACVTQYRRLRAPESDALSYRRGGEKAVADFLSEIEDSIKPVA